jgi:CheY-like chemotaxis protein
MSEITVLLVDDDFDFLQAHKVALEAQEGFKVYTACNGNEGMKIAQANHIDVAVLDVIMDTLDAGFNLARQLRKDEKTKDIALILLTSVNKVNQDAEYSFTFSDQDLDDVWLPVDKFLDKPVKAELLIATIRSLANASE